MARGDACFSRVTVVQCGILASPPLRSSREILQPMAPYIGCRRIEKQKSPGLRRGFGLVRKLFYFRRSKFFWRICQSFRPLDFSRAAAMIFCSLAFLVARSTL